MRSRPALPADAEAMTATIALAFEHDPIWGPAFGRADGSTDHLLPIWRLYVDRALETSTAWLADDGAAVALWTPPGGSELSDQQMSELDRIAEANLSASQKADLDELFARFEANHPHEPHAYLGLLATHPDHRGQGIAQQLLRENLAAWDAQGIPTYLESSNPANDHRYERAGYRRIGTFSSVITGADDQPAVVSMMWRDVP